MKISHAKVLITFLFYIDATFPETATITIIRLLPKRKLSKWNEGVDTFNIPPSVCHEENSGYGNYCNTSCAWKQREGSEGPYYWCKCSDNRATVTYLNNTWTCVGNQQVRNRFGCQTNTLFVDEDAEHSLRILNTKKKRETTLNRRQANCKVNVSSSWYIGCDGEMVPLERHTNRTVDIFLLQWVQNKNAAYYIKVVKPIDNVFLGRVINLGISCSYPPIKEGCLLFKLEGSFTCPVESSTSTIFPSTINPTMSPSSLEVTSMPTAYSGRATSSATIGPSQTITPPSTGRKQRNEGDSSSSSLGIIAGMTAFVTLLLLLIAAFFIYRRRKSRKDAHKSDPGQIDKKTVAKNSKTNSAFQLEEQKGFVKNHVKKSTATVYDVPHQQTVSSEKNSQSDGFYAALNIPEGHNIYGSRDSQHEMSQNNDFSSAEQPVYNVLEDLSVEGSKEITNNGPHEPEPVYNVLEEPYAEGSEEPTWYGSVPVDDPVYNTLEEPNQYTGSTYKNEPVYNVLEETEVSEEPTWYGSTPVDDPVYNTLEEPNQSIASTDINEPVYNVLEGPDQRGTGEEDRNGPSDVQEPLYNVLEGPDPEGSKDGLFSNSLETQDPGSCNTNIQVYAVVNKKKKMTR